MYCFCKIRSETTNNPTTDREKEEFKKAKSKKEKAVAGRRPTILYIYIQEERSASRVPPRGSGGSSEAGASRLGEKGGKRKVEDSKLTSETKSGPG